MSIADVTKFAASDYEINFTGGTAGSITRKSDGVVTAFTSVPITVDGLTISSSATANNGDRFLLKPFSTAASNISAEFSTPRSLAVASPIAGKMGTTNTGSLQLTSLTAKTNAPTPPQPAPVTITFTGANSYTRSDVAGAFTYTSGQAITSANWSVVLQGSPKANDTFTVVGIKDSTLNPVTNTPNNNGIDYKLNSGNSSAMMGLRDAAMFDGSATTDGYASMIAQIGVRSQSASYAAETSGTIAANLETDRTSVSGVNLDEEASKLLQYQQAYQASAKVIQVAQGIFDTLIQTMSR
jgi:flagellar hook-associated protein 1 FlgK